MGKCLDRFIFYNNLVKEFAFWGMKKLKDNVVHVNKFAPRFSSFCEIFKC